MWSEQDVITWLAAHPYVKAQLLLLMMSVSTRALKDWESFKNAKVDDKTVTFKWRTARKEYLKGIILAVVPPFVAKLWMILGG